MLRPFTQSAKEDPSPLLSPFPFGEDVTSLLFADFLDFPTRFHLGQTCRSALRFFALTIANDLIKALRANGFQFANFKPQELEHSDIIVFLNLLRYPYLTDDEKTDYKKWLCSDEIQAKTNATFWTVAIFCFFLINDIQINKPGIKHDFVTVENLPLFKELVKTCFRISSQRRITPEFLDRLTLLPTVQAQPLLRDMLLVDFTRNSAEKIMRAMDLGVLPPEKTELTEVESTKLDAYLKRTFFESVLDGLESLYFTDRRTAKWASGVLRTSRLNRGLFHTHFASREGGDQRNRFVHGLTVLQYLSDIPESRLSQLGDKAEKIKILFFDLVYGNPPTSVVEANRLCSRFISPIFLDYVCAYILNKLDHRAHLVCIMTNSLQLLSETFWKQTDWLKLSSHQLKIIEVAAEAELNLRKQLEKDWKLFPLNSVMRLRMTKLAYAFRPNSLLWTLPEEFVCERIRTFAVESGRAANPVKEPANPIIAVTAALIPTALIALSEHSTPNKSITASPM
jgi:hypothetical protein